MAGGTLTQKQMIALAYFAGFRGAQIDKIVAIAHQESGYNPAARNVNSDQWSSVDRGLFQINNHWHPDVPDACAYNPVCAARAAYRISSSGTDFGAWDPNVDGWTSVTPSVKASRQAGGWQQYVGSFAGSGNGSAASTSGRGQGRGPRGQPDDTNANGSGAGPGTGTADNGTTTPAAISAAASTSTKLFDCKEGQQQVLGNWIPGGHGGISAPVPAVGCYLLSTLEFVALSIGGVALLGIGVYMIATGKSAGSAVKAVGKGGVKAAVGVVAPEADAAELAGTKAFAAESGRQRAKAAHRTPQDDAAQRAATRRKHAAATKDYADAQATKADLPQTSRGKLYSANDEARLSSAMRSPKRGRPDRMAG